MELVGIAAVGFSILCVLALIGYVALLLELDSLGWTCVDFLVPSRRSSGPSSVLHRYIRLLFLRMEARRLDPTRTSTEENLDASSCRGVNLYLNEAKGQVNSPKTKYLK